MFIHVDAETVAAGDHTGSVDPLADLPASTVADPVADWTAPGDRHVVVGTSLIWGGRPHD